jgi:hypothetical protein
LLGAEIERLLTVIEAGKPELVELEMLTAL